MAQALRREHGARSAPSTQHSGFGQKRKQHSRQSWETGQEEGSTRSGGGGCVEGLAPLETRPVVRTARDRRI